MGESSRDVRSIRRGPIIAACVIVVLIVVTTIIFSVILVADDDSKTIATSRSALDEAQVPTTTPSSSLSSSSSSSSSSTTTTSGDTSVLFLSSTNTAVYSNVSFVMVISPFEESETLHDADLQMWQNVTNQYLKSQLQLPVNCDDMEVLPMRQALWLTGLAPYSVEPSLAIEFQWEIGCANETWFDEMVLMNINVTDFVSTSILPTADTQNYSDYISFLQDKSNIFQDAQNVILFVNQNPFTVNGTSTTASPTTLTTINPTPTSLPTTAPPLTTVWGSFILLETVPHDATAFTQGLEMVPGNPNEYFESTGEYGASSVRRVDVRTSQILQQRDLPSIYFGEGLTYFRDKEGNERLLQLTWQEGVVFLYDANTFELLEEKLVDSTTNGEGWGVAYVPSEAIFYVTDGTQFLHKWNASTLDLIDKVAVVSRSTSSLEDTTQERDRLNELEYDVHSGTILSNVWLQNYIVRINPTTGFITHQYDLTSLNQHTNADVLNGIAATDVPNEVWVTGKYWPSMYLIRLID